MPNSLSLLGASGLFTGAHWALQFYPCQEMIFVQNQILDLEVNYEDCLMQIL